MLITIIPKFLLEEESIIELRDMGVKLDEGWVNLCKMKIPYKKVYNLTECQVFDKLETKALYEDKRNDAQLRSYVSRNLAILFLKVRQIAAIKDKDLRATGTCALLAAVNSLAQLDAASAARFLSLIRGIQ